MRDAVYKVEHTATPTDGLLGTLRNQSENKVFQKEQLQKLQGVGSVTSVASLGEGEAKETPLKEKSMDGNEVVWAIRSVVSKDDCRNCMYGDYIIQGNNVSMNKSDRGGVYGIAIKLKEGEKKKELYDLVRRGQKNLKEITVEEWKPFEENSDFYPLYWGMDANLGSRLYAHTKELPTTWTTQLGTRGLGDHKIIFGAVFCKDREKAEKQLMTQYPDILRTKKGKDDS